MPMLLMAEQIRDKPSAPNAMLLLQTTGNLRQLQVD
jgi:hypothetical protein